MVQPRANRIGDTISEKVPRRIPRNSVALMRSIEIVTNNIVVGYVQRMTPTEGRALWDCREIGNEDLVEITPGGPQNMTIEIERALLYTSRMQSIFDDLGGNQQGGVGGGGAGGTNPGVTSLMDYNYPFDVLVLMRLVPGITEGSAVTPEKGDIDGLVKIKNYSDSVQMTTGGFLGANSKTGFNDTPIVLDHFHECWFERVAYTLQAQAEFQVIETGTIRYTWRTGTPMWTGQPLGAEG